MSMDFLPAQRIPVADLFDGRLEVHGITEYPVAAPASSPVDRVRRVRDRLLGAVESPCAYARLLTDGRNYLWVWVSHDDEEAVTGFTSYRQNNPVLILDAIEEAFGVKILDPCSDDPQLWAGLSQGDGCTCPEPPEQELPF